MLVRVDNVTEVANQWGYDNEDGELECIEFAANEPSIQILCGDSPTSRIYTEDIPNLIKALQAAYNSVQGKV